MMLFLRSLLFVCLCLMALMSLVMASPMPVSTEAADLADAQTDWEKDLTRAAALFTEKNTPKQTVLDEYKQRLRDIRDEALTISEPLKAQLASQQDLLKTLGKAPEDPEAEAPDIRDQRQSLNNDVAAIDARVKNAKLVIARAEELISTIEAYEQDRLRNELLARDTSLWSPTLVPQLITEVLEYVDTRTNWMQNLLVVSGILVCLLLVPRMTRYLNDFIAELSSVELTSSIASGRILALTFAAYFTLLVRLDVLSFDKYRVLGEASQAIAALCLSIILFQVFARIRVTARQQIADVLGEHRKDYGWIWNSIKRVTMLALMSVPVMVAAGYVNLGLYLAFNIYITALSCLLFAWLRTQAVALNQRFQPRSEDTEVVATEKERIKESRQLSPLAITIIEPVLALFSLAICAFFWGTTAEDVAGWSDYLRHGIVIGDITIDLSSIGEAIILFFTLSFLSKALQWFLSSRVFPYTALDMGLREATLTITGYIGVIIAILASMGAIGLNMSNLAIVAGALSVGIGFGLQTVFNNFVSGLILLFERPFKVGDWIVVGVHQGIIKKIRVRSTEIETFSNASIIVPNSQLISEAVTNWTLHDEVGRVDIPLSLALGSDTDKVRQVLLKIAREHPQVRTYPSSRAFLMNFGTSALEFELRCFIRNINDAVSVSSDLRFAIDKAFREQKIEMAMPSHDVYLHSTPKEKMEDLQKIIPTA
jgi:small-conductance mechanosensitive channel